MVGWLGVVEAVALHMDEVAVMADTRRLPTPVVERWDWQLRGACRDMNSAVFFHPEAERGPARAARIGRAKQVCRGCPVLEQCRRHALSVEEPYGVWGGLSESERHDLLTRRGRRRGHRSPNTWDCSREPAARMRVVK